MGNVQVVVNKEAETGQKGGVPLKTQIIYGVPPTINSGTKKIKGWREEEIITVLRDAAMKVMSGGK